MLWNCCVQNFNVQDRNVLLPFPAEGFFLLSAYPCMLAIAAVFEVKGSKKKPVFRRRGSSGDWVKDCLTWQEQIQYKVTMGYLH
jgi:hypothetical protein